LQYATKRCFSVSTVQYNLTVWLLTHLKYLGSRIDSKSKTITKRKNVVLGISLAPAKYIEKLEESQ